MTSSDRRRGALALVLPLLLVAASPLAAQDTAAVRTITAKEKAVADSIAKRSTSPTIDRQAARLKRLADSALAAAQIPAPVTPLPPKPDTTIVVKPDTASPVVIVTPGPVGPVLYTHPFPPPANGALLAEFPRETMPVPPPPSCTTTVRVLAGTDLQAAINSATPGVCLLLPTGATFAGQYVIPNKGTSTNWLTIRTDIPDASLGGQWDRMTVAKANALNLATIKSTAINESPLTFASGSHHVRLQGVRVTSAVNTNSLIRIGQMESDQTQLPHDIVLDRIVADPGALDVRRCVVFDGYRLALVSSTLANCHSNQGDSQGLLSINGRGVFRIENNTIQGGHQCLMFGGGDPAIQGQVPSDVVFRRNDCSRPVAWRGVWQAKTIFELKWGKRILVEGNVFCHVYRDAQVGYAVLLKTENQGGGDWGNWAETGDITLRYNRICDALGAVNLAARVADSGVPLTGVPMARVTIYGNVADSISNASDRENAIMVQGVSDVVIRDTWIRDPLANSALMIVGTTPRLTVLGVTVGGEYGYKGDGVSFSSLTPNSLLSGNTLVPWGTPFSAWPPAPSDSVRDALLRGVIVP